MAEATSGDRGDGDWAIAKVVESNSEAILVAGYLDSNGIPAQVESLHVDELPVNLGGLGEVRVRVPAGRLGEAQALLAANEANDQLPADAAGDEGEPAG